MPHYDEIELGPRSRTPSPRRLLLVPPTYMYSESRYDRQRRIAVVENSMYEPRGKGSSTVARGNPSHPSVSPQDKLEPGRMSSAFSVWSKSAQTREFLRQLPLPTRPCCFAFVTPSTFAKVCQGLQVRCSPPPRGTETQAETETELRCSAKREASDAPSGSVTRLAIQ